MRRKRAMAWAVRVALGGQRVEAPFQRSRVTIKRRSVGVPDLDNLTGGLKDLIDALLPASKVHPCGLGLIVDDSPVHMELVVQSVKVGRAAQGTTVTIEELCGVPAVSGRPCP